jgi:hypothetical protein
MVDANSAGDPPGPRLTHEATPEQVVRFTQAIRRELLSLLGVKRADVWTAGFRLAFHLAEAVRLVARRTNNHNAFRILCEFSALGDAESEIWGPLLEAIEAEPPLAGDELALFSVLGERFAARIEAVLKERGRKTGSGPENTAAVMALAQRLVQFAGAVDDDGQPPVAQLVAWAREATGDGVAAPS